MILNKAIFLDRDGVINKSIIANGKPYAPLLFEDFVFYEDTKKAIVVIQSLDYKTIIVTNQPEINKGNLNHEELKRMNDRIYNELKIDDIFVCEHTSEEDCDCRKPKPGMILNASKKHNIDLSQSFLIGDRYKDIESAHAAGCNSIFIDRKYSEKFPNKQIKSVSSFYEAAIFIKGKN